MKGVFYIMVKLLKITLLIFIFTIACVSLNVYAWQQIAIEDVKVKSFSGISTPKQGVLKENFGNQSFNTVKSKYNITGNVALLKVQTHNNDTGAYSKFVDAPEGQVVVIPSGDNTIAGNHYNLNVKNSESSVFTVNLWGLWIIN